MTSLRDEYNKQKQKKQDMVSEAAMNWLQNNVIVINERINRKSIQELIDKINKFDSRFGSFRNKLPSVSDMLNNAENGLILVLTGKTSDKRASEMLKQMTFTYNLLSSFFSKDLPLIMQTPMFNFPKENPEVRLDSLRSLAYNPDNIRKTFINALNPSKEEEKLFRKILNTSKMPHVESATIVNELMTLSYNDLVELSKVERVPMAVSPEPTPVQNNVLNQQTQLQQQPVMENKQTTITEAIDIKKLKSLTEKISLLVSIIKPFSSEMPETMRALNAASKSLIQMQNPSVLKKGINALKGVVGADAESQIVNLYTMFFNLKQAWPQMKTAIDNVLKTNDPNVDDFQETQKDRKDIQAMIQKAISPGLIKGAKGFSLLSAEQFTNELMAIISDEDDEIFLQPIDDIVAKTQKFTPAQQLSSQPGTKPTTNGNNKAPGPTTGDSVSITNDVMSALGRGNDPKAKRLVQGVINTLAKQGYTIVKQ